MTKAFALTDVALTDDEIAALPKSDLIWAYRQLREQHITVLELYTKQDRSTILSMAGNIVAGLAARDGFEPYASAVDAVSIARAIVTEVDR